MPHWLAIGIPELVPICKVRLSPGCYESRGYRLKLEVQTANRSWSSVAETSTVAGQAWWEASFPTIPAYAIRITFLSSTDDARPNVARLRSVEMWTVSDAAPPDELRVVQAKLLQLTNAERTRFGLPLLVANERLNGAAQAHAEDMHAKQDLNHTGYDGSSPADRIRHTGYAAVAWGENIAEEIFTAESVITAWIANPGYHANIRNSTFLELGVGMKSGYWVQDFGRAR